MKPGFMSNDWRPKSPKTRLIRENMYTGTFDRDEKIQALIELIPDLDDETLELIYTTVMGPTEKPSNMDDFNAQRMGADLEGDGSDSEFYQ